MRRKKLVEMHASARAAVNSNREQQLENGTATF
jgi:hypothetical protein